MCDFAASVTNTKAKPKAHFDDRQKDSHGHEEKHDFVDFRKHARLTVELVLFAACECADVDLLQPFPRGFLGGVHIANEA